MTPLAQRIGAYREKHPGGGPLHIAIEDGNLGDGNLDFCEQQAIAQADHDEEALEIIAALKAQSFRDRVLTVMGPDGKTTIDRLPVEDDGTPGRFVVPLPGFDDLVLVVEGLELAWEGYEPADDNAAERRVTMQLRAVNGPTSAKVARERSLA